MMRLAPLSETARGDGLGVGDIVLDKVDPGDFVRLHQKFEPVRALPQVVDGNIDVFADQIVHDPGPQTAQSPRHKETFVSHYSRSRFAKIPFVSTRERVT